MPAHTLKENCLYMDNTLTYGFTHLAIKVKDLQRTLGFYQCYVNNELAYNLFY